jgi:hypothetical protein
VEATSGGYAGSVDHVAARAVAAMDGFKGGEKGDGDAVEVFNGGG